MRFHLRRDFLHHLENIRWYFFILLSRVINKAIRREINCLAIILFYGLENWDHIFCHCARQLWKFFEACAFWNFEDREVFSRRRRACVPIWACGRKPIVCLILACMTFPLPHAGLSVLTAMFLAITPVTGLRRRWRLRPWAGYFYWWKHIGFLFSAINRQFLPYVFWWTAHLGGWIARMPVHSWWMRPSTL